MEPQFWQLEHFGDNCALVDEFGRSVTYQQLAQRADDFAQKLPTRCCNVTTASKALQPT